MKKANRSLLCFGLASAALCACAVIVGMTNHNPGNVVRPRSVTTPADEMVIGAFSSKVLDAKDTLAENLDRRFTDRQNVEFGMSRVIRTGARNHSGPTMDKIAFSKLRKVKKSEFELFVNGEWISSDEVKPRMSPENDSEREAIRDFKEEGVDVAIYTVGQFECDTLEKPAVKTYSNSPQNLHQQGFQWSVPNSIRAKGPAYTTQEAAMAPRSHEVVEFGRRAWASGQKEIVGQGKDGWTLFASRVNAPDNSCAKCHSSKGVMNRTEFLKKGGGPKAGDGIGLFIIALRK